MPVMNPPQQITIDQLTDEQLAIYGWNQYRGLEGARRQAQLCEQNILAISQELDGRAKKRQESMTEEEKNKKTEQDLLVDKLMTRLSKLPPANGVPEKKASPDAGVTEADAK